MLLLADSRSILSSREIEAACGTMFAIDGVKLPCLRVCSVPP